MANPKSLRDLHRAMISDGVVSKGYDHMVSTVGAKGDKGIKNRQVLYNIATEGGYFTGSYADFAKAYFRPATPQKAQQDAQKKQQIRDLTGRDTKPAQLQKPAATPQGQKPAPVQQPKATPNKPDSVAQQYMPTYPDPTKTTGQSKNKPKQGTGVLKTDAQIMADDSLSAEDKVALINDNRRRRGQSERNFNDYQEVARDAGVNVDRPNAVEGFTDNVMAQHETYNTAVPFQYDTDGDGQADAYRLNAVNKTPNMLEQDYIKEIADEINYYNTKQDQGGGGTTRIEDAINAAYDKFMGRIDQRGAMANAWANVGDPMTSSYLENLELERTAGIDAVAKAAYDSFPQEVKDKYGEDVVRDAVYQVTFNTLKEKSRPKNYGAYLAQQLTNTVPGIISKAIVRRNSGSSVTLSDIADMSSAEYAQQFENEGLMGDIKSAVGGALPMVADPVMLIPFGGPAAKIVTTGLGKLAAKQAIGRGLEAGAVKLATKAAANKLINRGLTGAASTAVQMAAYEEAVGLANMANGSGQNFWDVTGEALESGAKMAPIGFIAPGARVLKGRVANSITDMGLSRGMNWAANTGAKLGISTGAFITEAGVFAAPDIIGLAVNGTYTNEQARDIAIHSIASLAAFKAAGMFNPLHLEQTKAMIKSMVSGTMGTELALNSHDSEALKRLGYGEIQGDNIMNLFVPLTDRPEAKNGGGYFSQYSQIVLDERVPWSTRAKLMYIATGMLPETGVRPNEVRITTDQNGRTVVTTLRGNNPISQRFYDKKHRASAESYYRKANHDVERMNYEGFKQDIINEHIGGMPRSKMLNDALDKKPQDRTAAEQRLVDAYQETVAQAARISEAERLRVRRIDKLPDPEEALKKPSWQRTAEEKEAVERYREYLLARLDNIRKGQYDPIARDMAQGDADELVTEMLNERDGKLYQCFLRDENGKVDESTLYTIVDFDGTIENPGDGTGMNFRFGTNGDKMTVRNTKTGETKIVTSNEIGSTTLDVREGVQSGYEELYYNIYLKNYAEARRRASWYGKEPQDAVEGERLTLAADDVDPTTGLRPEYTVINKDGKSGTFIVEDAQGNRKLINGHDILQKITDIEPQIPTQIAPQVPPTGPQTPPPAAPAQEPPVQEQGETPTMPEQGDVFKLKVGDEFVDAEVIGKDDTGIIVRYEDNGTFRTEHLTPEELAPRLEQQEAPAAPATPPAQGEGGTPAAPVADDNIPRDGEGNRLYHKLDQKAVEEHLKGRGLDDEDIMAIADSNISKAQKDLDDANTALAEARASGNEDGIVMAKAVKKDAQERLDWWNKFKEGYGKEEVESRPIEGMEGHTEQDVKDSVRLFIEEQLANAGIEGVTIKGMALHGSRMRGDARPGSDLDVVVEYEGDISEDGLFNLLNEEPMYLEGIKVDINPITKGKSGTLEQYMERSRQYDEQRRNQPPAQESEPDIPHSEPMPARKSVPVAPARQEPTTPEEKAAAHAENVQRWNNAPKVYGHTVVITLPNGEMHRARYVLSTHDAATASHDALHGYMSTPGYPEDNGRNANDRDYTDKDNQVTTERIANDFNGLAFQNPPIVNTGSEAGHLLGGNGTKQAHDISITLGAEGKDGKYLDATDENIPTTGISRRAFRDFLQNVDGHPMVYLELVDEVPHDTATMKKFNDETMKSNNSAQSTLKIARLLTDSEIVDLDKALNLMKGDDLEDLMGKPTVAGAVLKVLVDGGYIGQNQVAQYTEGNGTLSARGIELVRELIRGTILDERAIKALNMSSDKYSLADVKRRIDQLAVQLVHNASLGDFSLKNEISRAVEFIQQTYSAWNGKGSREAALRAALKLDGGDIDFEGMTEDEIASERIARILSQVLTSFRHNKDYKVQTSLKIDDAVAFFEEYERNVQKAMKDAKSPSDLWGKKETREDVLKFLLTLKKYKDLFLQKENGPEQPEQGEGQPGKDETAGGTGSGNQGNGGPTERGGQGAGSGEGPVTPPRPGAPGAPQGGGEPPKGEGEPPKPEEPGKPAGEPAGAPAASEPHQLTVDEVNSLDLPQRTKDNAIAYINGDTESLKTRNAYQRALREWERVNGKSGEGKPETPPATPEDNGPQEPPKGGGTTGRGGSKPSTPKGGGKPTEPKPAEPKPEGEGPKNNGGLDLSGLGRLKGFKGVFGEKRNESRRPSREGEIVNEARYIPEEATEEQLEAVEATIEELAKIGKQLVELQGMRTQSELVDFMRGTTEIREALEDIGFDDEDMSTIFREMWSEKVSTPKGDMKLSEYADELSKTDKPKQIVSPMEPTVKNVVYKPSSKGKTNESIIPASMVQAVKTALSKINDGDTDGFVMDKVGFKDKDELYDALNAEQIDGVALAISAIERGEGLILGDMTGIGKGRQLAAVIRYARKEGIRPVFVTEKPGLFKDMMRDLLDVGADTPNKPFRPLILASADNGDVTLANGSTVKAADAKTIEALLSGDLDKLAKGYDALFVTYANINNAKPETFFDDQGVPMDETSHDANTGTREPPELTKKKLNLIAKWARGSIVVMDEAHNAAGVKSTQGVQWREIIDTTSGVNAKGVVMASATYAKTPKNYVLYSLRTPIKEAHLSSKKLEEVFVKGGVPLQEWLAGQLTGESYIRRERDMTGVNFDYRICVDGYDVEHPEKSTPEALEKVKAIRQSNDKAAKVANTLLALDNVAKRKIQEIRDCLCPSERSGKAPTAVRVLVRQGDGTFKEQTIDPASYPNRLKVKSSSFSSRISQINAQLFMAEKAESAADAAIAALKEGELPMIVFENTFDSLMKELPVDENGVLESVDYAQAFVRYLERLGNFTVDLMQQNPVTGAWEELKCRIDLSKDPESGFDFSMAKDMIENEGVGLHVSPVDRIRERLEEAGYKVGELSGRKFSIQKLDDGKYHRVKRTTEDPDKITDDYNTGKIDVLLINASGSTGRSMHNKGVIEEDGRRIPGKTQSGDVMADRIRHQIYVQNFNNETTMVQAMGRIDRTGQMDHGKYTFLMTPVPAETNILMRAQRKREQLKANTTAQQDRNSFDAVNASDFINKYGDEVVAEYLMANPEIREAMRIEEKDVTEGGKPKEGIAKKATMNAYTLTCEQQQEFYDKVQAEYDEYVRVLKENGDYDLETQVVDLQAETLAEHMFVRGSHESDSMFSQDTNIARCRVKIQKKPLKLDEIYKHISERTGTELQYEWNDKLRKQFDKHFADMEAEVEKEYEGKTDPAELAKKLTKQSKIANFKAAVDAELKRYQLDLLIPFFYDTDEVTQAQGTIDGKERPHAIVYDIKLGRTLGSSSIIFAVNDGRQKVAVRMNDAKTLDYIMMLAKNHTEKFDRNEWDKAQTDAYEDAFIITGNLIGAYHNDIAMRGRMIRYTDSEGNLKTGILMPRNFKTSDITVQRPISEMFNTLMSYANEPRRTANSELPKFADGNLEIEDTRHFDELRFIVKGNKEGELAFKLKDDPDLKTYRTSKNPLKFTVSGERSIRNVLGILAGRYGVSASVAVDPAYFMTREERDKEAESRMFRVNENIEETTPSRGSLNYGMPYTVHVPKERRKNMDVNSDWYVNIISQLKSKGFYGAANFRRTMEGSKRVYDEFFFENKKMAEEFIKMVNEEPVRPLAVDEKVEVQEPRWEEIDRSRHTYQLSDSSYLTGEDIATTFGFRNVDTGHFRPNEVRDLYNAFMTMAMLLNIDPKSISLGGNMDVQMLSAEAAVKEFKEDGTTAQFKTSGKTNSYTGATQKKMQFRDWASSFPIAHEWLHALDNYFGTFGLKNEETGFYEQNRHASESADRTNRPWTARPEMREAWVGLLRSLVDSGFFGRLENEQFFKGTSFTDSKNRPKYWGKRTEMLARAFEPYLRKKITEGKDNLSLWANLYGESEDLSQRMRDMITQGNDNLHGPFDPTPKEQAVIDKAFDKFFETIREKRDPDTGRVIMYEQAKPGETKREATMRETRNLNRVLAKTGLANSVTIDSERDFAEGVFASTGRPMRTLDGIVYGYTDSDGNIHLNAKYLNFETPIHEYGHLWSSWAKKNHGDLWQRGIELAKESDAFKKLKEESKKKGSVYNGMTDDQLADEVLADAIGKKGQDMYDPKDWTRTARVKHWLTQLWHRIGEALGFRKRMPNMAVGDMSFDDIIRTAAGDILSGKRMKGAEGKSNVNFEQGWHGSGADFDAFDNTHIGEGEGHQSHGYGIYIAKNKDIAKGYATGWLRYKGEPIPWAKAGEKFNPEMFAARSIADHLNIGEDFNTAAQKLKERAQIRMDNAGSDAEREGWEGVLNALSGMKQEDFNRVLYEVDIPDDNGHNYLDEEAKVPTELWDKFVKSFRGDNRKWAEGIREKHENESDYLVRDFQQMLSYSLSGKMHSKKASEKLSKWGYVGIKYKGNIDGDCYVVFNDSDVKIKEKTRFQASGNEKIDYYPNGEVRRVRNFDEHGNLTRVMEYDENRRQIRHWEPRIGTDWKRGEDGVTRGTANGVQIRPYDFKFQQDADIESRLKKRYGVERGGSGEKIGKDIGEALFVHRSALGELTDAKRELVEKAMQMLPEDAVWNSVKIKKDGRVTFQYSPDFDTADEPIVEYDYQFKNGKYEKVKNGQIWHHKWNWVTDDYDGFDVQASKERSEQWKDIVAEHLDEVKQAIADYKGKKASDIKQITGHIGRPNVWDNVIQPILRKYADNGVRFQQGSDDTLHQKYTSADTSINNTRLPSAFSAADKKGAFKSGTTNMDMGAGSWPEIGTEFLAERGVKNYPLDPFNLNELINKETFEIVKNGGFDTVTCSNVLNVIAEPEIRSNVILQMAKALKPGGTAYITVYVGDKTGNKRTSKTKNTTSWQEHRKTDTYVDEVKQHFNSVERKGELIIAKDPKPTDKQAQWFLNDTQSNPIRFQQAPANRPSGDPFGNADQLHIARQYAQDRTRTTTKLYEEVVENSVSLRHVLEDIAKKSGKPIADYENVYLAENQSHGMMTTELITFRDRRVNPLDDALRKLAKHYGGEPTKNYVWARHGIERSIYVCFRERAYELAEKEAEAAARARGEEVTDKDINDAYNAMLDELYNATSGYSRRAYLENLENECSNILSAHGDKKPFEVTDKAGLTALNDKRSLVDDKPIENAWEIVREYENNAGTEGEADVEALFDRLNDISKSMLDYSRDKGMMDKDTVEKIRKMFRFYVPLQGFAEGTMAQDYFEYVDSNPMRAGRAVPNTPKMRGRTGESADPIATLVRNAEMTIAAARRNTVATHLYNLATSRDTDLFAPARAWEAYDAAEDTWVPSTPDFTGCETAQDMMDAIRLHDEQMRQQRELGLAREAQRGFSNRLITAQGAPKGLKMSMRQRHEHAVPVRINGKENVIYVLSDPRIAQIVNGTDKGRVDKDNAAFLNAMARLTRFRAGLMTSYSIPFWFRNGARDIQNAFIRQAIMNGGKAAAHTALQGFKGDPMGMVPWEAMRLYNKAVKGTLDESNKHERYFKEFFEHGGITGYAFAEQAEKIQSRVKKLLEHPNRSGRRLMFAVGEWLERSGGAFEIAPRFAAYIAGRDSGKSIMQSVADAKEATVNFDRRGARRSWLMRTVAALYAFHNPGIQGMQNRLHMWHTKPTKTTILHAAGFVMGHMWKAAAVAMLIALNRKDDEYDTQLTEHDRRNNLCFPVGDDDWVKIPINMEDRVLFGLGDAVRDNLDVFNGNRYFGGKEKSEYDDGGSDLLEYMKLISAWFPIDPASENNWVPTNLQPFYDVYVNHKDYRGQAVDWRSERNAQEPEYKRINPSMTSKMWVNASKWWSEKGGGTSVRRAKDEWHEINPQHMQYLFQSFLGGLGSTLGQVESLVETMASDNEEVKWNSFKFPIASSFWKGNLSEYSSTKDDRKKSSVWRNWADEVIRIDREYRKRGAEHEGEDNKLTDRDKEDYKDNLRYLELAKRIHGLADKKSQAKKKATKEGRMLSEDEESEIDNAFNDNIPDFEQEFVKIDGERKAPDFRKHYDDD